MKKSTVYPVVYAKSYLLQFYSKISLDFSIKLGLDFAHGQNFQQIKKNCAIKNLRIGFFNFLETDTPDKMDKALDQVITEKFAAKKSRGNVRGNIRDHNKS